MKRDEILNNYTINGDCWEWKSHIRPNGYGRVWFEGRMQYAHRVVYELVIGKIPKGEGYHGTCVCHKCDNRKCVNPAHLFLGSNADNVRDKKEKGRAPRMQGEANGFAKLTADQVREIRRLSEEGLTQRAIANRFGISQKQVSRIVRGKRWAHLDKSPAGC
jgi:DNA-binding transcriptional regulator YiaG